MFDLMPWRDSRDLSRQRQDMDRFFERFFEGFPFRSTEGREWMPVVDISQTPEEVVVKAELAGMDPKDIDISLNDNVLTLRGERKQEEKKEDENYYRMERRYGSFSRSVMLPAEVERDKVEATYKNGVLEIHMPKTKKEAQKKIEVKSA